MSFFSYSLEEEKTILNLLDEITHPTHPQIKEYLMRLDSFTEGIFDVETYGEDLIKEVKRYRNMPKKRKWCILAHYCHYRAKITQKKLIAEVNRYERLITDARKYLNEESFTLPRDNGQSREGLQ